VPKNPAALQADFNTIYWLLRFGLTFWATLYVRWPPGRQIIINLIWWTPLDVWDTSIPWHSWKLWTQARNYSGTIFKWTRK